MRRFIPSLSLLLLLAALPVLSGCGYQLRGSANLPEEMARTRIVGGAPNGELVRELRLLLDGAGVEVIDDAAEGSETARLVLLEDRIERVVQSVGASARVREFALEYVVRFRLAAADGTELMPVQRLRFYRDYQFDEQQVLGTTSEETLIRQELVRDMSRSIVRRLEDNAGP